MRSCGSDYEAASFANKARSFLQHERITKATKLVAFFLSSRELYSLQLSTRYRSSLA